MLAGLHLTLKKNRLVVVGSDLDLTIRVQVEVGGEKDGMTVIPAALGAEIMRALDSGQVQVDHNMWWTSLSAGSPCPVYLCPLVPERSLEHKKETPMAQTITRVGLIGYGQIGSAVRDMIDKDDNGIEVVFIHDQDTSRLRDLDILHLHPQRRRSGGARRRRGRALAPRLGG